MNTTETGELLRTRRQLTGEVFNDDTITAWQHALADDSYERCRHALNTAAREHKRITVAHIVELLPQRTRHRDDTHPATCICNGHGWIETEQHDDRHTWLAWTRCPDGPPTGFTQSEPDEGEYLAYNDPRAQAALRRGIAQAKAERAQAEAAQEHTRSITP